MSAIFKKMTILFGILFCQAGLAINVSIVKVETNNYPERTSLELFLKNLELEIFHSPYFTLIERNDIDKLIAEKELKLSGLTEDADNAKDLLPVNEMIYISVMENGGKKTEINAKFLDTDTGKFTVNVSIIVPDKRYMENKAAAVLFKKILAYYDTDSFGYCRIKFVENFKLGKYTNALSFAKMALEKNPSGFEPHMMLGDAYKKLQDREKAEKSFSQALELLESRMSEAPKKSIAYRNFKKIYNHISRNLKQIKKMPSKSDIKEF